MKKIFKFLFVAIIIYFIVYCIFHFTLAKNWGVQLLAKTGIHLESYDELYKIMSGVIAFIGSFLNSTIVENWLKQKTEAKKNSPYINMTVTNTTCFRKNSNNSRFPIVKLKEKNKNGFYCASISLKNVGNSTISQCFIQNQEVSKDLKKDESIEVDFYLYANENSQEKYYYPFFVMYKNERGNKYRGLGLVKLNTKQNKIKIKVLLKQRRM